MLTIQPLFSLWTELFSQAYRRTASLLDAVEKSYDNLERMPLMYEACHDPYLKELGYRKVGIRSYVIVYKVDEEAKTVNLMRFFHSRQDYEALI